MIGIYFSGTGNTKLCVDKFLAEYDNSKNTFSIEDKCTLDKIKNNHKIVIGYPVQYSNIPKILRQINTFGKEKRFLLLQQWGFSAVTAQEY